MTCSSSSDWPLLKSKVIYLSFVDQELSKGVFIATVRPSQQKLRSWLTKLTVFGLASSSAIIAEKLRKLKKDLFPPFQWTSLGCRWRLGPHLARALEEDSMAIRFSIVVQWSFHCSDVFDVVCDANTNPFLWTETTSKSPVESSPQREGCCLAHAWHDQQNFVLLTSSHVGRHPVCLPVQEHPKKAWDCRI